MDIRDLWDCSPAVSSSTIDEIWVGVAMTPEGLAGPVEVVGGKVCRCAVAVLLAGRRRVGVAR